MRRMQLTALGLSIIGAAGLAFAVVSCDSNAADPPLPGGTSGGVKGQHVLVASNTRSVATEHSTVNSAGGGTISYNEDNGNLELSNYNESGGLRSVVEEGSNAWTQNVAGNWPAAGNGGIRLESRDNAVVTSQLDITQATASGEVDAAATFTGGLPPCTYTLVIRYCNGTVVRIPNVPCGALVRFVPPTQICCNWLQRLGFYVTGNGPGSGRCIWRTAWNACCCWRIFYLGVWYNDVVSVDFAEGQDGGAYPYHTFTEIRSVPLNGGIAGTFSVTNEASYNRINTPN